MCSLNDWRVPKPSGKSRKRSAAPGAEEQRYYPPHARASRQLREHRHLRNERQEPTPEPSPPPPRINPALFPPSPPPFTAIKHMNYIAEPIGLTFRIASIATSMTSPRRIGFKTGQLCSSVVMERYRLCIRGGDGLDVGFHRSRHR